MTVQLRMFTESGNEQFTKIMREQNSNIFDEIQRLTSDESLSHGLGVEIELIPVVSRFQLGEHLWKFFHENRIAKLDNLGSPLLWNWLSASWMKILVEADPRKDIDQKIGRLERWVLTENFRRYYLHVVSNPFFIYANNAAEPEKAIAFLATDVLKPGDLVDKIASNRRYQKPPISHLVSLLYYDKAKKQLRPGHTSRAGEGNQLSKYLNQIDRTVDFEGLSVEELVDLLPQNFSEWVGYARRELADSVKNKSRLRK
jgi:hypothetical protein